MGKVMKKNMWILWLLLELMLAVAAGIGIMITRISYRHEQQLQQQVRDSMQDDEIEALKKEVRLLKTDLYLLQHGFEGVNE